MHKTTLRRHALQTNSDETYVNSRHWRGRSIGNRGFTNYPNKALDSLQRLPSRAQIALIHLRSHAHNQTGLIQIGPARLAVLMGKSVSTADRAIKDLVRAGNLEGQYNYDTERGCWGDTVFRVVLCPADRIQTVHKPVETSSKIDPTPGVKNDVAFNIKNSELRTTTKPPVVPQGGRGCESSPRIKRGRHEHHHAPRERRGCGRESLTAFQVAALEVMRLCGVADTSWRIRDGIAAAIALHVEGESEHAKRAVEPMVIAWKDYLDLHNILRCPFGIEQFFVQGAWCDERQWRVDRDRVKRRF